MPADTLTSTPFQGYTPSRKEIEFEHLNYRRMVDLLRFSAMGSSQVCRPIPVYAVVKLVFVGCTDPSVRLSCIFFY